MVASEREDDDWGDSKISSTRNCSCDVVDLVSSQTFVKIYGRESSKGRDSQWIVRYGLEEQQGHFA